MKQRLLKKSFTTLAVILACTAGWAQNWTWMKGNNTTDIPGNYGTINVPAASNNPGSRMGAFQWKDAAGNFWLFGGEGFDASATLDVMNDLWRYNPGTNQWTWISGSNTGGGNGVYGVLGTGATTNIPGARIGGMSWSDNSGNLWLFGGSGYDALGTNDILNDLWKYNIASNQWTWMGGSNTVAQNASYGTLGVPAATNIPGARLLGSAWSDNSGNLWLMGGLGLDASSTFFSFLNDLWRYNISTGQWTWMHGSNVSDMPSVYGTINVPAAANTPGSRFGHSGVTDASGNLWLMGGLGYDATSATVGFNNDLWRYNVTTGQWTWIRGSQTPDQNGVYGTLGSPAASNEPGSRMFHNMWADGSGNLWAFGGDGFDQSASSNDYMNDLWRYNITSNQWTWMKGSNSQLGTGVYGTQGVAATANTPGARFLGSSFVDNTNSIWLFGGSGSNGYHDDLWKFFNCSAANLTVTVNPILSCAGQTRTISVNGANTYTWSTSQQTNAIVVNPITNTVYVVSSTDGSGCGNTAQVSVSVTPGPTVTITSSTPSLCAGSSATLTGAGASTYTWNATVSAPTLTLAPLSNTVITVIGADALNCTGAASISIDVSPIPTLNVSTNKASICAGESATLSVTAASSYSWHTSGSNTFSTLVVNPASTTNYTVTITDNLGCQNSATISQTVNACASLEKYSERNQMSVYPNPSSGTFNIRLVNTSENTELIVISNLGQIVYQNNSINIKEEIQLDLAKGFYVCILKSGDGSVLSQKLVVE